MVGILVLAACIALGLTLDDRVSNPIPVVVLTVAGCYGGWLLGVVVYGAVRGVEATGGRDGA